jgi:hypothetical protein
MGAEGSRWEWVRIIVGVAMVGGCGWALWSNSVSPLVEKGLGGGDVVREVKLGVYRLALERKRLEFEKEARERRAAEVRAGTLRGGEAKVERGESGSSGGDHASGTLQSGTR